MELRPAQYHKRTIQIDFHAPVCASFPFDAAFFQPHWLRANHDFAFFLYYDLPGLHLFQKAESLFVYQEAYPQGYISFQQSTSEQYATLYGDPETAYVLWGRLLRAYALWQHVGKPPITHYRFEMDEYSQWLLLDTPSGVIWPFGKQVESE